MADGSQQRISEGSPDSKLLSLAGGGFLVSNTDIDGNGSEGIQLYDSEGVEVTSPNLSVSSIANISSLTTGGFVVTSAQGNIQRYDRYGNKSGGEIELDTPITEVATITSLSNGNVLVSTATEVQLVDFNADNPADQSVTVQTKDGADLTGSKIASVGNSGFWVLSETEELARQFDINGVEIVG